MDKKEQFYEEVKKEQVMTLATGTANRVTMRIVSPAYYDGKILMFTNAGSKKYQQLKENPNCSVSLSSFFAEAVAEFCGACMLPENEKLREVYSQKYPGSFDEGVEFGGRDSDFVLLTPTRLSGWAFENDIPTESGIPTIPFEISLI